MAGAYLEITLKIEGKNREAAGKVYARYREPFLRTIEGTQSKELLVREEDVQVLHGFETAQQAWDYLQNELFKKDVVRELAPLLAADPEIRIYTRA
jgi:hypothetical protein